MSPTAKASGWPGIERSGSTSTRPERSSSTPSVRPSGAGAPRHPAGGGPPANHTEREERVSLAAVLLALGGLDRRERGAGDLERVFGGLDPRRQHSPLIVAKVGGAGARREDERVVADVAS